MKNNQQNIALLKHSHCYLESRNWKLMSTLDNIHSALVEAEQRGSLITALASTELKANRPELGDILCSLHNANRINLLSEQNLLMIDALEELQFWNAVHSLNKAIPNLKCSHYEILRFVHRLVQRAGSDIAGEMPNRSLITWSQKNPDKALKIVDGIKDLNDLSLDHGTFAVLGLNDEALTLDLIQHSKSAVIKVGLQALGLMEEPSITSIKKGIDQALNIIERETDTDTSLSAIQAAFRLWEKSVQLKPYRQREVIEAIGKGENPNRLKILAAMLSYYDKGLSKESINQILDLLATTTSDGDEILHHLHHFIMKGDGHFELVKIVPILAACISSLNETSNQQSHYSVFEWVWSNPQHASYLFAKWLNEGKPALCSCLVELLHKNDNKPHLVWIQKAHLPPTPDDQIFVARKCIGFLWNHEVTAASILLSIVKNGEARACKVAEDLLFNPLLLSYDGALRDFLETQRTNKSKRIAECVTRLFSKKDSYIKGLEATNGLVELFPTTRQRRAAWIKHHKLNCDIQKQAFKQSALVDLTSQTQMLLYGRKTFSIIQGADGAKHPNILALSEHPYSLELPRLMIFDPIQFNSMIKILQHERKTSK